MDEMNEALAEVGRAFRDAVGTVDRIYGEAYSRYRSTAGREDGEPTLDQVQYAAAKLRKIAGAADW